MIEINNLIKSFGDNEVLKGINAEIGDSEVVCIIGPSGSGKSTMLRCINMLEIPTDGEIIIDGEKISESNINDVRTKMGMVFQNFNLFPNMTVIENITCAPINVKGVEKSRAYEKARELLSKVKLPEKADVYPGSLSGGQQQRLCIARALAVEPEILLMDEPTSALDPISTLKIEDLMDELKQKYTVVIVTHNMQQATRIADYTAFFLVGEIIEYAPTTDLFSHPKEKKTEDYITGRFG